MKTPTALVLFFCAGSATPEVTERPLLKFHGNVAFDEVVYRSTLDLPENARAIPAEALAVSAKLLGFLRRAGYDLATVRAKVEGEQISVEIDEGRLDKIIVLGEGLMETFRFKLELALPAGVFNRPILERQLRVLAERYRLRRYSYELVPVAVQESSGPQVEELESLPGLPGIHPGWPYELHILIATSPWSRGFSPEISTGSPEGLGVGGQYREQDFLVPDDRWELRARVAGALREHLDSNSSRAVLTRVFAQGRWFSPPVLTESLRPALTVRGDLLSLQRSDLRLDSFHQATFAASVDASVFRPRAMVALGVGIERRFLLSLVKAIGANPLIDETPRAQTRPYAEAIAEISSTRRAAHRPQEPAGFRGARLLRIDFQRQGPLDARFLSAPVSLRLARAVVGGPRDAARGWGVVSGRGIDRQPPARCVRCIGLCAQAGQHRVRVPLLILARCRQVGRLLRSARLWCNRSHGQHPVPGVRRRGRAGAASAPGRPVPGGRLLRAGMEDRRQRGLRLEPRAAAGVLTSCTGTRRA